MIPIESKVNREKCDDPLQPQGHMRRDVEYAELIKEKVEPYNRALRDTINNYIPTEQAKRAERVISVVVIEFLPI
ncbi:hypothetical protein GCM10007053_24570 [Halioglobus pacificus]|uniref:Uncharacterized protein n=1 Tax=Parahalioglobus pacificus TaxID=930806 RepID=A0A918XKM8_9GAMM|nr:hypothetical protein GCM10007053_24570 [Halioglobus pacificus]